MKKSLLCNTKKGLLCITICIIISAMLLLSGCGGGNNDTITIGSKNFTENILIGEILAQLIEDRTALNVKRNLNMAGTFICFEAIKNGEIDIYPEYTGTALTALLELPVIYDKEEVYELVKAEFTTEFEISWMEPFGLNNTYAVITSPEVAEAYNLQKTSDLIPVANELVFAANHEFFNREDGYEGFIAHYGLGFKGEPVKMDITLLFPSTADRDVDVIIDAATAAPIRQYNLVLLEDDQQFFPPYHLAPIVRNETLEKYPELEGVLNLLAGQIDDATMTALNYKVDVDQKDVADVAAEYLREKGLVD